MNNVIKFPPRQRVKYRYRANVVAAGTVGGACGYWLLASLWPETFLHWLAGLLVVLAVLITTSVAAWFHAQKVRLRREDERRIRDWRERQAEFNRTVRAQERAALRAAMEAPTEIIPYLRQRPRDAMLDGVGSPLGRLWDELNERTGEVPTPPHGWRSGVA